MTSLDLAAARTRQRAPEERRGAERREERGERRSREEQAAQVASGEEADFWSLVLECLCFAKAVDYILDVVLYCSMLERETEKLHPRLSKQRTAQAAKTVAGFLRPGRLGFCTAALLHCDRLSAASQDSRTAPLREDEVDGGRVTQGFACSMGPWAEGTKGSHRILTA